MFDAFAPYFSILPHGLACLIAFLGLIPSLAIILRAPAKYPTRAQSGLASIAGLVGAWGFSNAVMTIFEI